jgi:hypothetical protein
MAAGALISLRGRKRRAIGCFLSNLHNWKKAIAILKLSVSRAFLADD